MKVNILYICLFITFLVGCKTDEIHEIDRTNYKIIELEKDVVEEASASAYATKNLLSEDAIEEAKQVNDFTVAALPKPNVEKQMEWDEISLEIKGGKRDGLDSKFEELGVRQEEIDKLKAELEELKALLVAESKRQKEEAEEAARLAEIEKKQMDRLQIIFGVGAVISALGIIVGMACKSLHISIACAIVSAFLGFMTAFLHNIPGWVFHATPVAFVGFVIWIIIAFRNGLNRPQPEKKKNAVDLSR